MENSTLLQLPPAPLKPSVSIQDEALFHNLYMTPLPIKEVDDLSSLRDSLSPADLMAQVDTIAQQITQWLGVAHMTVFTLEQKVKEQDTSMTMETKPLEDAVGQMQPLISVFIETATEIMEECDDDDDDDDATTRMLLQQRKMTVKLAMAKIQSEWSGLQHFVVSVVKAVQSIAEEKSLTATMEHILVQLNDISTMIFQYHEKKHSSFASSATPSNSFTSTSSLFPSLSAETRQKDESILAAIDEKVEPVFRQVERVYARMTAPDHPPADKTGVLVRKHAMVQSRWEHLRAEIDDLKDELKEDRWLTVFRQVADQVDVMIDGLEKTTAQCYAMIQQIRDWHASGNNSNGSPGTSSDVVPRGVLRNAPRSHPSTTSISSSSSSGSAGYNNGNSGSPQQPPIDQHKFRSVEKNFEAKYKYYTPSIDRMLGMLGNGIASRVGQDMTTSRRHQSMLHRWHLLKNEMDEMRARDLPETERILVGDRPISPAYSRLSDRSDRSMSSMRFRSPEPMSHHEMADYMMSTGRAKSPLSRSTLSRTGSPLSVYEDNRRGRSATPNSGGGGGSSGHRDVWRGVATPSGRLQRTVSPLSFSSVLRPSTSDSSSVSGSSITQALSEHQRRTNISSTTNNERRKSRVPDVGDDRASWMKPTKSSLLRKQKAEDAKQQQQQQQQAAVSRPKTPTHHYDTTASSNIRPNIPSSRPRSRQESPSRLSVAYPERAMSPVRRSGTPSLIPRPKTPSGPARAASPAMVPRPRSSMQMTAPVAHSSPPPTHGQQDVRRSLRKKQSMPAMMHRTGSPMRSLALVHARTPSPHALRSDDDYHNEYNDNYHYSGSRGEYNHYEDDDDDDDRGDGGYGWSRNPSMPVKESLPAYKADPKDPLDIEVGRIVNASPIAIKCQKGPNGSGRYYFGSELSPSVGGGKKLYTCKLMSYTGRRQKSDTRSSAVRNKVLVRVGGGWQDLELFLLHYGILH